jgi:hypothetical protein
MADEEPKVRWLFEDEPNGTRPKPLGLWSGAKDNETIPPTRDWLLGTTFCRGFLSSLVAEGGTGKSALRMTQALALATGRPLTGEKVWAQTRVLYISLEDDAAELRRRLRAALMHHGISHESIRDWMFLASPGDDWNAREPVSSYTLAYSNRGGEIRIGEFLTKLHSAIFHYDFGLVIIDPFIKLHALNENSNPEIDFICRILATLAMQSHVAIDLPHHTAKLIDQSGSRSNRARGGSAFRDAVRLLYTLAPMTAEEGALIGVDDDLRRSLVRLDPGKLNVTMPALEATWFRLHSVNIQNGTPLYPDGDNVQAVGRWTPPRNFWDEIPVQLANDILDQIEAGLPNGQRYSNAAKVDDSRRVWRVVQQFAPSLNDAQAKNVIATWFRNGTLTSRSYTDPISRNEQKAVFAGARPG